jgi:hypothetical protein
MRATACGNPGSYEILTALCMKEVEFRKESIDLRLRARKPDVGHPPLHAAQCVHRRHRVEHHLLFVRKIR